MRTIYKKYYSHVVTLKANVMRIGFAFDLMLNEACLK